MGEVVQFRKPSLDEQFDEFWGAYPRKVAKLAGLKAYRRALKLDTHENIMAGLRRQKWPEDKAFIPYPATFLNAGRWLDGCDEPKNSPDESKRWDHLAWYVKKGIRPMKTHIGQYELDYLLASGRITEEEKRKW